MPRESAWTDAHVDHLVALIHQDSEAPTLDLSTKMSRHFKQRITPTHINMLLQRMRNPNDVLYRSRAPFRRKGAKFAVWR